MFHFGFNIIIKSALLDSNKAALLVSFRYALYYYNGMANFSVLENPRSHQLYCVLMTRNEWFFKIKVYLRQIKKVKLYIATCLQ